MLASKLTLLLKTFSWNSVKASFQC